MKKKISIIAMVMAAIMIFTAGAVYGDDAIRSIEAVFNQTIKVKVDGYDIHSDEAGAIVYKDRTFVQARALAEALKGSVSWDEETQTVNVDSMGTMDFSLLQRVADDYHLKAGVGTFDNGNKSPILKVDWKKLADMGYRVSDYGDETFQLISISNPEVKAGFVNPAWTEGSQLTGGCVTTRFEHGWTYLTMIKSGDENTFYTTAFTKGKYIAMVTVGKNATSIYIQPLVDYMASKARRDAAEAGQDPNAPKG